MANITSFSPTNNATITVGGSNYWVENANQGYSLTEPDSDTLRFQLQAGDHFTSPEYSDPSDSQRDEVSGSTVYQPDTQINLSYDFMVEPGATDTSNGPGKWTVLGQMHEYNVSDSPPFAVELVNGDHMAINIGTSTLDYVYTDPNPIVRGQYYSMQIQMKFDDNGNGFLEVWRDGVQIVNYHGSLGTGAATYWKEGIYRSSSSQTMAVDYKDLQITTGAAAPPTGTGSGTTVGTGTSGGSTPPTGTGSGTTVGTGASGGATPPTGTGSGTTVGTGASGGATPPTGTGSGTHVGTGASGGATPPTGTGSGTTVGTGASGGATPPTGTGSGTTVGTGASGGATPPTGTGSGTTVGTGASGGATPPTGTGSGTTVGTGASGGATPPTGTGSGTTVGTGASGGATPPTGTGSGTTVGTGASGGATPPTGTGSGTTVGTGASGGATPPTGTGSGTHVGTGASGGVVPPTGTGSGTTVGTGASGGVTPPKVPVVSVADSSLSVSPGHSVALGLGVSIPNAGDKVTVNISGLPKYETITDNLDHKTFSGSSITLTAAEVNSGLTLTSSYSGHGDPSATLTVTATDKTGKTATSAAQTITVKDPPASVGGGGTSSGGGTTGSNSGTGSDPHHGWGQAGHNGHWSSGQTGHNGQSDHGHWFGHHPDFAPVATTLSDAGASKSTATPSVATAAASTGSAGAKSYALLNQMMAGDFGHDSHFAQVASAVTASLQHSLPTLSKPLH